MLSCAGADRLQTGMRHAFGKPTGLVARVQINQILMSVRVKATSVKDAIEGLRRCKFKFPGAQKILVSRNWGFSSYTHPEYKQLKAEGRIIADGSHAKIRLKKGPLQL
eukprot:TRINITY_DN721_c0_g2_i2.p1 TRINITY_DN721_c0_g2~~TRINITY_DN721_c0_g2_i2.p1  ORF type:complete len:108 (-),score=13.56 TRINITY_DN721_c0_g2_i2:118-441(-)